MTALTSTNVPQLEPCPCCNGIAKVVDTIEAWVECTECGLQTRTFNFARNAAETWNTRPAITTPSEPLRALLEKCKAHLIVFDTDTMDGEDMDAVKPLLREVLAALTLPTPTSHQPERAKEGPPTPAPMQSVHENSASLIG